jgi:hypothetical protein
MPSSRRPARESLPAVDVAKGVVYEDRCCIVEGVVSPEVQGGSERRGQSYAVHIFTFADWRRAGEPLVGHELVLLRRVPCGRLQEDLLERFPAFSVQRLSALLSKDGRRAVVARVLAQGEPDARLRSVAERLREPVMVPTRRFGRIALDRSIGWFEGKASWNGRMVAVRFKTDGKDGVEGAVRTAETLWDDQAAWKRKVDDFALRKLLPLKNGAWRDDGEARLTPAAFKKRMKLKSLSVDGDGRFEFWHDDGNLFGGHSIQIVGSLPKGLTRADLPG